MELWVGMQTSTGPLRVLFGLKTTPGVQLNLVSQDLRKGDVGDTKPSRDITMIHLHMQNLEQFRSKVWGEQS